ncbi:RAC-gamma serine/threonine-protein kinase [Tritrichomonas musculus]|uniref:RAC-gamma serine/threonine-protein kinase n=1 Tax=Tritrichomonas musculus TaxID=1915356 RepID=A0ABR2JVU0_9EUKA
MTDKPQKVVKEGWCTKLGEVFKTWKKRWFVLSGNTLNYYADNTCKTLKGTIQLSPEYEINRYPQCKKQPAFSINTFNRLYQIVAPNEVEINEWIQVLNKAKLKSSSNDKVTLDDFDVKITIGKGAYGKVTLVQNKFDHKYYALKSLNKKLLQENDLIERTLRERDTLMKIHSPFLVSAHYSFQTDTHIFLAQDFMPGGELFSRMAQVDIIDEEQVKKYMAMLILGVGELHSAGIIHRDLKPENILFDEKGYLKISDFGLVQFEIKKQNTTTTFCGTPEYIAPEIYLEQPYGRSVDWWALAVISFRMLFGVLPFNGSNFMEIAENVVNQDLSIPDNSDVSANGKDLMRKLLIKDPAKRLGSGEDDYKEIQSHPWFDSFPWEQLLEGDLPMDYVPDINEKNLGSNFENIFTTLKTDVTPLDPKEVNEETQQQLQGFTMVNEDN